MTSPPPLPSTEDPDPALELRPSERRILSSLSEHGELTQRELLDETGLARGTVCEVLPTLKRRGVVTARPSVTHPRADVYSVRSRGSSPDGSHNEDN